MIVVRLLRICVVVAAAALCAAAPALAADTKPNILVIWGDDIGIDNISAYNLGIMGYRRPTSIGLRRKARCSPTPMPSKAAPRGGHRSFSGQHPFRTGLLTIGMPGSPHGIPDWAPTIADLLKSARLCHRPVRQEPPRRPGQAAADRARLRRVPRQPVSLERRGGTGDLLLPEGPRIQEEVRPARA